MSISALLLIFGMNKNHHKYTQDMKIYTYIFMIYIYVYKMSYLLHYVQFSQAVQERFSELKHGFIPITNLVPIIKKTKT